MKKTNGIEISVVGVFRAMTAEGMDITPVGQRPRAALAAIALSPRKTASRRWLETLLWADRGPEQASGSLRQVLTKIRKGLGPHSELLQANRSEIWLGGDVTVDALVHHSEPQADGDRDVLEGFDIRSEPFEDWLRMERERYRNLRTKDGNSDAVALAPATNTTSQITPPSLFAEVHGASSPLSSLFADSIRTQLGKTAAEFMHTQVIMVDDQTTDAVFTPGSRCIIRMAESGGDIIALSHVTDAKSGRLLWSRRIAFDKQSIEAGIDSIAALALEASEVIAGAMEHASSATKANALAAAGLKEAFTFNVERLQRADTLLEQANELEPHAPRPALRALVQGFLATEGEDRDKSELAHEVKVLVEQSLTIDQENSLALAFLADVQDLIFRDSNLALSFAKRALTINPGTGYAHASLGALELRRDRPSEALAAATKAKAQLENTSLAVFSLMRYCVAAISDGRFKEAAIAAERAAILAPDSRPPLRHLYALKLHLGDFIGAREVLISLRRLEPNFSLSHIRENPDYPADTLRKCGLIHLMDAEV